MASATEAVAGRYFPAALAGPGMGIVPPVPGFYWIATSMYYHGSTAGDVPFGGGSIAVGLEADMYVTALAGIYVPKQDLPGNWTYAFQGAIPVGWTKAKADVGPFEVVQEASGLGDIAFAPAVMGWHSDAMDMFFALSLTVTAPTGEWGKGDLAFIGLNYWTFTPGIAFTRLIPEYGLDFSGAFGIDINTRNTDTDYYSGAVAHPRPRADQEPDQGFLHRGHRRHPLSVRGRRQHLRRQPRWFQRALDRRRPAHQIQGDFQRAHRDRFHAEMGVTRSRSRTA